MPTDDVVEETTCLFVWERGQRQRYTTTKQQVRDWTEHNIVMMQSLLQLLLITSWTWHHVTCLTSEGPQKTSLPVVQNGVPASPLPQHKHTRTSDHTRGSTESSRRTFLDRTCAVLFTSSLAVTPTFGWRREPAHAVRAVGGGELECRAAGNCLEKGEWDGAIGWTWGGKDRCEATDPTCGANGQQVLAVDANGQLVGKPVPFTNPDKVSHVVVLRIDIGRDESNVLKLGLYGNDDESSAELIQQLIEFVSSDGLSTLSGSSLGNTIGQTTAPVSLSRGGVATWVTPGSSIEFGVPSQSLAYAKSRGSSKVLDAFVPQPRPTARNGSTTTGTVPLHSLPGLVSVPKKGLGYGGTGFESDDECYERTLLITNAADPALDKTRQVIGQVLDASSMAFLQRLTNIPTNRGIRGVLPGQTDGPPLPRVAVRDVAVATVVNKPPPPAPEDS